MRNTRHLLISGLALLLIVGCLVLALSRPPVVRSWSAVEQPDGNCFR